MRRAYAAHAAAVDAVDLVGTNLPMSRMPGVVELWLGKLVISPNTATYWNALRESGITDKVQGSGD